MSKLIACLGYHLQLDNSIHSVLENRLKDAAELCAKNPNSTLLLMGSSLYGDRRQVSEASVMKNYLEENFGKEIKGTKIITEEITLSAVEQLCYLKKFMEREK